MNKFFLIAVVLIVGLVSIGAKPNSEPQFFCNRYDIPTEAYPVEELDYTQVTIVHRKLTPKTVYMISSWIEVWPPYETAWQSAGFFNPIENRKWETKKDMFWAWQLPIADWDGMVYDVCYDTSPDKIEIQSVTFSKEVWDLPGM